MKDYNLHCIDELNEYSSHVKTFKINLKLILIEVKLDGDIWHHAKF